VSRICGAGSREGIWSQSLLLADAGGVFCAHGITKPGRGLKGAEGLRPFLTAFMDEPNIDVSQSVVGVDAEGLAVVRQRLLIPAQRMVGDAAAVVGPSEVGVDLKGLAEVLQRLLIPAQGTVGDAAVAVGHSAVGVDAEG